MKNYNYQTIPTVISLDELFEKTNQDLQFEKTNQALQKDDWQYKFGLYYELDPNVTGEMANIFRIMKNNFPSKEKEAIKKTLDDKLLNDAERKAKQRGIKRLRGATRDSCHTIQQYN